jgi:uncharacterized protein with HEPN domain
MSDRQHSFYIVDIFIAMDKIHRYTEQFRNAQELLDSELEWDAAIRELEIIGEATNYLLKANQIDGKYRRIVDFRNQIIHGYFGIDENIVFDVIRNKIPRYFEDLVELSRQQKIDVLDAIKGSKKENSANKNVIDFLNQLAERMQQ